LEFRFSLSPLVLAPQGRAANPERAGQYFGELIQIDGSSDPDALFEETGASSNVRFADADV
jgi:hypothetical protein